MKILIKGGRIIDPHNNVDEVRDLLVGSTVFGKPPENAQPDVIIDACGFWVVPGLIDLHAHFREPGLTHKEDMESGAKAAVRGGFTTVCAMPNTAPPLDNHEQMNYVKRRSNEIRLANILPIGAITLEMKGRELTDFEAMMDAGAVAFSEDGLTVKKARVKLLALELANSLGIAIFSHCEDVDLVFGGVMNQGETAEKLGLEGIHPASEDVIIARDIALAEHTGARLHICHISTAGGVQLVREAKARGVLVTAEVCPHHFTLADSDIKAHDTNFKMNPPLRSPKDIEAIKTGLSDGTIDAIATDHAPHHAEEKAKDFSAAPFGIVGLETALPLSLALVREGVITPNQLVRLMSLAPAEILGLERGHLSVGAVADITIIDPDAKHTINPENFASKGRNTPFAGWEMQGEVVATIVEGRIVYDNRQID